MILKNLWILINFILQLLMCRCINIYVHVYIGLGRYMYVYLDECDESQLRTFCFIFTFKRIK